MPNWSMYFRALAPKRSPDFLERPLSGLPEHGPGQRLQKTSAQVKCDGLVEGEGQARPILAALHVPSLAAKFAHGLLQGEARVLKGFQIAANGLLAHLKFVHHVLDGQAVMVGAELAEKQPLTYQGQFISHHVHPIEPATRSEYEHSPQLPRLEGPGGGIEKCSTRYHMSIPFRPEFTPSLNAAKWQMPPS